MTFFSLPSFFLAVKEEGERNMPKIWIETTPNDKIAWVHLEPVGKYSYEVSVSEELHARLKDNPLQPDDPMSELLQACIQLGYRLGGEDDF